MDGKYLRNKGQKFFKEIGGRDKTGLQQWIFLSLSSTPLSECMILELPLRRRSQAEQLPE
jgi:hypothetical protein